MVLHKKAAGKGAFGEVERVTQQGRSLMLKRFIKGSEPLSTVRTKHNESIAAYLTSKNDPDYARKVDVAQPSHYLVRKKDGIEFRIDHVSRHDSRQAHAQPAIGCRIFGNDFFALAFIDWDSHMRISFGKTVSREMFTAIGHPRERQPVIQTFGQQGDHARIAMKSAVANDLRLTVVEIKHRRE